MGNRVLYKLTAALFAAYDMRMEKINKRYDRMWSKAFTAEMVLRCNEWHARKTAALRARFSKSVSLLNIVSEVSRRVRGCFSE